MHSVEASEGQIISEGNCGVLIFQKKKKEKFKKPGKVTLLIIYTCVPITVFLKSNAES